MLLGDCFCYSNRDSGQHFKKKVCKSNILGLNRKREKYGSFYSNIGLLLYHPLILKRYTMYSDLHCHSFLRPFSRTDLVDPGIMPANPCDDSSVWHKTREGGDLVDLEHSIGFVGYTQTDFTNVFRNNDGALLVVSLFAVEAGFFELRKGVFTAILTGLGVRNVLEAFVGQLISKFGKDHIRDTQDGTYDYFDILMKQVNFVMQSSGVADTSHCTSADYAQLPGKKFEFVMPGGQFVPNASTIKLLWSIEGGNSLWSTVRDRKGNKWNGRNFERKGIKRDVENYTAQPGLDYASRMTPSIIDQRLMEELIPWEVCDQLKINLNKVKGLQARPFFISIAHHFYNGLCGHASSLQPLTGVNIVKGVQLHLLDQWFGCNSDITNLGWVIINEMLKDRNKRILVDTKHMSVRARLSYYEFRRNHYADAPIICSHGAVYGGHLRDPKIFEKSDDIVDNMADQFAKFFYKEDINLLDDDIMEIVKSNGIIGVEFDKRVNGVKADRGKNGQMPDMIWHNMRYIAEVATLHKQPGQSAWDFISLGTDYDGIINPIDNYGTAETIPDLRTFVRGLLTNYLATTTMLKDSDRQMNVNTILDKIFFQNIIDFAGKYYR